MTAQVLDLWLIHLQFFSVMFIPDEMKKSNKFQDVAIPSNRSYFARLGEVTIPSSQFTGDEVAPIGQDKISQIEDYAQYAESLANNSKDE